MKIQQVLRAHGLIEEREQLIEHMARKHSGLIPPTRLCDEAMMEALAVPYAARLRQRLSGIEQELIGMGVDLNSPSATVAAAGA